MRKISRPELKPRRVPMLLQLGCAHVLWLLLASGCLLVVNMLAVTSAFQIWLEASGNRRQDPRMAQTILILCPLILLFLQYWCFDRIRNWLAASTRNETG